MAQPPKVYDRPTRIKRERQKGWRMPENTIYVGRAGCMNTAKSFKWGNPWPIGSEGPDGRIAPDALGATGMFEDMLNDPERRLQCGYPQSLEPLRGKNLMCWCALNQPCHADVLLREANK